MTGEIMIFRALLEKSSDADLLREMIGGPHLAAINSLVWAACCSSTTTCLFDSTSASGDLQAFRGEA